MQNLGFLQAAAFGRGAPAHLKGRTGLLLLAAAIGVVGLVAGSTWLGIAAVLPLLYILPCAAMMVMCMRGHGGSGNAPVKPDSSAGTGPGISQ